MSPSPARKFPNLAEIESKVKEVAAKSDIPSVTYPSVQPAPVADGEGAPEKIMPIKKARTRKVEPAPVRRASVDLPVYLLDKIDKRAFDEKIAKRKIFIQAFRAIGFDVADVDYERAPSRED